MINHAMSWLDGIADQMPEKIAVCDAHGSITYGDYRRKSQAIAREITCVREREGLPRRIPVAVYLEKSHAVLVSFMGIAYSGGFYSPIDVDMPAAMVNKILEILQPKIVITSAALKEEFKNFHYDGKYIIYEEAQPYETDKDLISNIEKEIVDTDLLYVLFTSGSTGIPKGVSITHRSVVDYIDWVTETFGISADDSFGNQAPFYFDNSILDIYSCMKTGATLYIIPQKLFFQPVPLLEYLKDHHITTIFWVPSALIVVSKLRAFRNVDLTGSLKRVLFCGEVMPNKQLNIWRKYLPDVLYANLYGPTEITDACAFYVVDREFADDEPLPIGKPMRNTEILVLDENNNLVHGNNAGELCVRGTSLAAGYYNNPDKTRAAFVQNPLNKCIPEIIYRTGDLVKYNSYGELVYLARKDFQIKHMGHRIELGEIETAVSSLEGITLNCCLYDEKTQRIVLFVDADVDFGGIQGKLREMIPEYMIPTRMVYMKEMPMNANGKIDRVKLKEIM